MRKSKSNKKFELTDFIEANHKLVSVLGVFTALTVFASSLQPDPLGVVLSLLFFTQSIIIWLELWRNFPGKGGSELVSYFEIFMTITIAVIGIYWLLLLYNTYVQGIFLLMFSLSLSVIGGAIKKLGLFRRLFGPGKKTNIRYALGFIIVTVCALVSVLISNFLMPYASQLLEAFEAYLYSQ